MEKCNTVAFTRVLQGILTGEILEVKEGEFHFIIREVFLRAKKLQYKFLVGDVNLKNWKSCYFLLKAAGKRKYKLKFIFLHIPIY